MNIPYTVIGVKKAMVAPNFLTGTGGLGVNLSTALLAAPAPVMGQPAAPIEVYEVTVQLGAPAFGATTMCFYVDKIALTSYPMDGVGAWASPGVAV